MKYIIYTRTSYKSTFGSGSPERQIAVCKKWMAAKEGYILAGVFSDRCECTVPLSQRPEWLKLQTAHRLLGDNPLIVVESVSRIGRGLSILQEAVALYKQGIQITPIGTPNIFNSPKEEALQTLSEYLIAEKARVISTFEEVRSLKIEENKKKGIVTLSGAGKFGGRISFLEKFPAAKSILLSHPNAPYRTIQLLLEEAGIKASTGNLIAPRTIRRAKDFLALHQEAPVHEGSFFSFLFSLPRFPLRFFSASPSPNKGSSPAKPRTPYKRGDKAGALNSTSPVVLDKDGAGTPPMPSHKPMEPSLARFFELFLKEHPLLWVDKEKATYFFQNTHWDTISIEHLGFLYNSFCAKHNRGFPLKPEILALLHFLQIHPSSFVHLFPATPPHFIPFQNGVFDTNLSRLLPHAPHYYNRFFLPYDFPATFPSYIADFPNIYAWFKFLTKGDDRLLDFLFSVFRVTLHGRLSAQFFLELIGPGGSGKSTFATLLRSLLGDQNVADTDLTRLEHGRFEPANFKNKLLVLISDLARDQSTKDLARLRSLVARDSITSEEKYKPSTYFVFQGLVLILTNHPLVSSDHSNALERRRVPIFFDAVPTSPTTLLATEGSRFVGTFAPELPAFLSYILSRDLAKSLDIFTNPFAIPSIQSAKDQVSLVNPLKFFMEQHLLPLQGSYFPIYSPHHFSELGLVDQYDLFLQTRHFPRIGLHRFKEELSSLFKGTPFSHILLFRGAATHYLKHAAFYRISGETVTIYIFTNTSFRTLHLLSFPLSFFEDVKLLLPRLVLLNFFNIDELLTPFNIQYSAKSY